MVPGRDTTVVADRLQLEQILVNLLSNACDAQKGGGSVVVRVARRPISRPLPGPAGPVPAGEYVILAVQDAGSGIPSSVRDRIFDPFFTRKEVGEGTGLGLSAVPGIARQCGGQVVVDSEPGRGTTVEVWFPYRGGANEGPTAQAESSAVSTRS